jgi:hypothetical protein
MTQACGTRLLEATNLKSPPGLFGIMAYRKDVILDKLRIDASSTSTSTPPANPANPPSGTPSNPSGLGGIPLSSPWIIASAAWVLGVVSALAAVKVRQRLRRDQKRQ